jgi:hypothetical protein
MTRRMLSGSMRGSGLLGGGLLGMMMLGRNEREEGIRWVHESVLGNHKKKEESARKSVDRVVGVDESIWKEIPHHDTGYHHDQYGPSTQNH